MYKVPQKDPNYEGKNYYKKYKNKLTVVIEKTKQTYYRQKIENTKNNSNQLWNTAQETYETYARLASESWLIEEIKGKVRGTISNLFKRQFFGMDKKLAQYYTPCVDFSQLPIKNSIVLAPTEEN